MIPAAKKKIPALSQQPDMVPQTKLIAELRNTTGAKMKVLHFVEPQYFGFPEGEMKINEATSRLHMVKRR
eukprot:CAMPEP_0195527004 /NCGR_PEP_ID=MMETSP0794_2-20130614/28400_1 /TAXON_ID=515487 /ORGANISM="Stephanopyxis turris, Strain CCMP 815" /LENGTH=69 /DNA_ID=CAMNT_0040657821 /DNA_START=462 /DNA_END=671 /DNA_ORIENTATION=+